MVAGGKIRILFIRLKNPVQHFGANADSIVLYGNHGVWPLGGQGYFYCPVFWGVLQGIAENVDDALGNPHGVPMHPDRLWTNLRQEPDPSLGKVRLSILHSVFDKCIQINILSVQNHLLMSHSGHIEETVD